MGTYKCISCEASIVADFDKQLKKGMMKKSENTFALYASKVEI